MVDGEIATLYTRAGDQLIGLFRPGSGTGRYYHSDGLGSVRALSDEIGAVTDRYTYTAFGELLEHAGSDVQPYRFAGEPLDPNSGFYYNRARWLDVAAGRFLGVDPAQGQLRRPLSQHPYLYALASPADWVDPSGETGTLGGTVASAAVAGIVNAMIGAALGGNDFGSKEFWDKAWRDFLIGGVTAPIGGVFPKVFFRLFRGRFIRLLEIVGNMPRLTLYRGPAFRRLLIRISRFFVNTNRAHPPVQARFVGRFMMRVSNRFFPNVRWEHHHVFIQQFWSRAANGIVPEGAAREGLRRIGNGLWNLLPIPKSLNAWFSRHFFAAELFATAYYAVMTFAPVQALLVFSED